mmetsp:Transcript_29544/g.83272  ORF Transcript_29544/g.83272 Transcript_29544/m.83272 type:complete len:238 (-) Transcript_29544:116-829(-)|eukprot:CAMPEP_0179259568 /NCGR_PEP_ID=MMETSP0797-20121207/25892_1 /TAXON_ID=47934 /ORGANISM="Dinophysis acuminata, Strain DAEP01" /LENGTH=237 /DNA_ID=CAMNT_0020967623 /DNA_START=141 /DNA_END=854 /DNA_ORIENTATION=-
MLQRRHLAHAEALPIRPKVLLDALEERDDVRAPLGQVLLLREVQGDVEELGHVPEDRAVRGGDAVAGEVPLPPQVVRYGLQVVVRELPELFVGVPPQAAVLELLPRVPRLAPPPEERDAGPGAGLVRPEEPVGDVQRLVQLLHVQGVAVVEADLRRVLLEHPHRRMGHGLLLAAQGSVDVDAVELLQPWDDHVGVTYPLAANFHPRYLPLWTELVVECHLVGYLARSQERLHLQRER